MAVESPASAQAAASPGAASPERSRVPAAICASLQRSPLSQDVSVTVDKPITLQRTPSLMLRWHALPQKATAEQLLSVGQDGEMLEWQLVEALRLSLKQLELKHYL